MQSFGIHKTCQGTGCHRGYRAMARRASVGLIAATLLLAQGACRRDAGATKPVEVGLASSVIESGEVGILYERHCAACHGVAGHGDGPAADLLYPRPRAFRDAPLRFAATGRGSGSVVAALEQTIRAGVPRSAMPGFAGVLNDQQIRDLARYVQAIAPRAETQGSDRPLPDVVQPRFSAGLVDTGRLLFRSAGCAQCHGEEGHGDGPGMKGMVDSLGRPVQPANLASGLFKSGSTPADLYRTIINGVPGTPMAAFKTQLVQSLPDGSTSDLKVWALVAYIESLSAGARFPAATSGAEIRPQTLAGAKALPDPTDRAWLEIGTTQVTLRPTWQREEHTVVLDVALVRAGEAVGLYLRWEDQSPDVGLDLGVFPDALAVMFAMGDEVPALPMGVQIPGHAPSFPVNIWQWKASRQYDASSGVRHDADKPRTLDAGGFYLFKLDPEPVGAARSDAGPPGTVDQDIHAYDPYNRVAVAAGNPHASAELLRHAVLEANAEGFGTLSYQQPGQQQANASALWTSGHWSVQMFRPIDTGDPDDIDLTTARRIPVAFAVWDGAKGDRDGMKLVSGWHWIVIEPARTDAPGAGGDRSDHREAP